MGYLSYGIINTVVEGGSSPQYVFIEWEVDTKNSETDST